MLCIPITRGEFSKLSTPLFFCSGHHHNYLTARPTFRPPFASPHPVAPTRTQSRPAPPLSRLLRPPPCTLVSLSSATPPHHRTSAPHLSAVTIAVAVTAANCRHQRASVADPHSFSRSCVCVTELVPRSSV
ncbi:hypothetical protein BVRB_4g084600 [Beta vulgaris subsp. vulgaris]|nr:hypothetical protein BVRB_4g084600 [Beta vulgaris subsp. vulgaris]